MESRESKCEKVICSLGLFHCCSGFSIISRSLLIWNRSYYNLRG